MIMIGSVVMIVSVILSVIVSSFLLSLGFNWISDGMPVSGMLVILTVPLAWRFPWRFLAARGLVLKDQYRVRIAISMLVLSFVSGVVEIQSTPKYIAKVAEEQRLEKVRVAEEERRKANWQIEADERHRGYLRERDELRKGLRVLHGTQCLSGWNGAHPDLVGFVKENARNPNSFEHIETIIGPVRKDGESHLVRMKYRAENGFGGMNVEVIFATVDPYNCEIINVFKSK
jgi:hypothetical protein